MCEHEECEHSLGPGSRCVECDRLKLLRQNERYEETMSHAPETSRELAEQIRWNIMNGAFLGVELTTTQNVALIDAWVRVREDGLIQEITELIAHHTESEDGFLYLININKAHEKLAGRVRVLAMACKQLEEKL